MTASAWSEVRSALSGALRLAVGDRRGLRYFDVSIDGFWHSFRAAAICYPFYLFLLALRVSHVQWQHFGIATIFIVETIAYVISWVIFPLVILPLCGVMRRDDRFLAFMVAYNWSQVPQTALFTVIGLDGLTGLLPPASLPGAEFIAAIVAMLYEWYIARVALAAGTAVAVLIVLIDLLLGTALSRVAEALY
jgi:hypothetical protein